MNLHNGSMRLHYQMGSLISYVSIFSTISIFSIDLDTLYPLSSISGLQSTSVWLIVHSSIYQNFLEY